MFIWYSQINKISKFACIGQGIAFDGKGFWSFNNDNAGNAIIFAVDNSLSPHIDNPKNDFLILGEGPTGGINGSAAKLTLQISK